MKTYEQQIIATQHIADLRREADAHRLAKSVRPMRSPVPVLWPLRRLVARLAPAT